MKITKSRLKQIIKEELSNLSETDEMDFVSDLDREQTLRGDAEVPPQVALMENLWDVVRGFYKLGRSDVAIKLQKIAEMADEGHERLVPRGEGTPGFTMPGAPPTDSQEHQRRRFYKNRE